METINTLTLPIGTPAPTAGNMATIGLRTAATIGLTFLAGILVHRGWLDPAAVGGFVAAGIPILAAIYMFWRSYGSVITKAELDILRAKALAASAAAQRGQVTPSAALASVAAHVEATTPLTGPAGPVEQAVADKGAASAGFSSPKAVIALAIGIAALGLLQAGAVYAQTRAPVPRPFVPTVPTGNPITDIGNAIKGQQAASATTTANTVETFLAKPFQDLAKFIGDDSEAAITLSTQIPELQDGHGQQCWLATRQFGDVVKAHPVPLTLRAQTDLEALRLLMMAANNLCSNVHCTQVFGDLTNGIQSLAPLNASIPIPSLHDLCSKVPQIAVIPAVSVPVTPPPPATPAAPNP